MGDWNVIELKDHAVKVGGPRSEKRTTIVRKQTCFHRRVSLYDDGTRVTECDDCKAKLDPFDVLMDHARKEASFVYSVEAYRAEKKRLEAEIEELKRQKRNLGAQVRRATKGVTDG